MAASKSLSPEQKTLRGKVAANTRWSREDPRPAMEHVRKGFWHRFEKQVDPDGTLPPAERQRRAEAAMRAHMASLALKSSKARAKGAGT